MMLLLLLLVATQSLQLDDTKNRKSHLSSVYYHHNHHPENNFERIFFRFRLNPLNHVLLILLLIAIAANGTTILRYCWIPMINPPQQAVLLAERILLLLCAMPSFPMKVCFPYFPPPYLLLLLLMMVCRLRTNYYCLPCRR